MSNFDSGALGFFGAKGDLAHKIIFPALHALPTGGSGRAHFERK